MQNRIGSTDFEAFDPPFNLVGPDGNLRMIQFFTTNDEITLEYNDTVTLEYVPDIPDFVQQVEFRGEFIRNTTTVYIIDNDRKPHTINTGPLY